MSDHEERLEHFTHLLRQRGLDYETCWQQDEDLCQQFRGHYAVLVLDSSGFTRITRDFGIIHFLSLVVNMRDRAVPIFQAHSAIDIWAEADNLYGIFPSAAAALTSAVRLQQAMAELNAMRSANAQLDVCIGIGCGPLLYISTHHIFGQEMNFASKLGEDVANPREILLTAAAYDEIKDHVSGLEAVPLRTMVSSVTINYYKVQPTSDFHWKE